MRESEPFLGQGRRLAAVTLALAGLAVSVYTRVGRHDWCAQVSGAFDCDKVLTSRFGVLLGIPLSVWGAAGFLLVGTLLVSGKRAGDASTKAAAWLTVVSLAVSAALLAVAKFKIGAFCLLCNLMQMCWLGTAIVILPRALRASWTGWPRAAVISAGALLLLLLGEAHAAEAQRREFLRRAPKVTRRIDLSDCLSLGSPTALHTAVAFIDFGCPNCRKCYEIARSLVALYPDRVRFLFKHFPLDKECNAETGTLHPGACIAARAGQAAALRGHGPAALEYLFGIQESFYPSVVNRLAERIGIGAAEWRRVQESEEVVELVARDVADGRALQQGRVPITFLDGRYVEPDRIEEKIR